MKFYSTVFIMTVASAVVMAASPESMEMMCSESTNKGKCEGMGKDIDTSLHCNKNGDKKCNTSYCCMDKHDDDKDDHDKDDKMMCSHKTNQGKCKDMGKDVDKHRECHRNGDSKCSSSFCCKDHDNHEDDKMMCSHKTNQGKCEDLGKGIDKHRKCERHNENDMKCASSHCCEDHHGDDDDDDDDDDDHHDMMKCSRHNNHGVCKDHGLKIDRHEKCKKGHGHKSCASKHCCKKHHGDDDDDDDDDDDHHKMQCGHDTNQGKCERLGKKINKHLSCNRYGHNKCASSYCCKDGGDHDMECSHETNQGKCERMHKEINKGKSCNRYSPDKCASSHCCH